MLHNGPVDDIRDKGQGALRPGNQLAEIERFRFAGKRVCIQQGVKGIACIFYGGFVIISSLGYRRKTLIRGICLISWGVGSILGLIGVRWKEYKTIIGK